MVGDIAAEQLVRPLAGQHHLHVLCRQLGQEVQRHGGQVGVGLVGVILDGGQGVEKLLRRDGLGDVAQAQLLTQGLGLPRLVEIFVGKAHGVGLVRPGQGGDDAGVDAAGQEGAHLHVADLVGLDGLGDNLPDLGRPPLQGHGLGVEGEAVVGGELGVPVPVEEIVAGEQAVHPLEKGLVEGGILEGEVELQSVGVELLLEARVGQEALALRAEEKQFPHLGVVEGLDAEGIPGAEQLLFLPVPDDEGKHTPQLLQHPRPPLHVAVEHHLGVAVGAEAVALGNQLLPQLPEVVGLAVVGDDVSPVGAEDGLLPLLQVEDGQAAVGDAAMLVGVLPLAVGAPVADGVAHGPQGRFVRGGGAGHKAGKTAHRIILQFHGCVIKKVYLLE